ncbi:hypothetical protein [Trebonia sp.]|uniref:hypothetical protein n=1 Tax=Trebonia sp. TaxID=2767075 RepID=UPI003CC55061
MTGYHTRWARAPKNPLMIASGSRSARALAFGKALYDVRTTLGLSVAELALRASLTEDDIECIEEGDRGHHPPCCATSPPIMRELCLNRPA